MLTLDAYQEAAVGTAIYPGQGFALGLSYVALKLNGEAGEVAENVGKAIRDDEFGQPVVIADGQIEMGLTEARRENLIKELGDVLWYIAAAAEELNVPLSVVAERNIAKLASRKARGVLGGSGDNR